MSGPGHGRLFAANPKDKDFLLPAKPKEAKGVVRRHWISPGVLDQGSSSTCVIHAGDKLLTTQPVVNKGWDTFAQRNRIYKEVQALDEWPGEDYDGTSVRAMMKWLKAHGYITEYNWASDCEAVINHVLAFGPVQMGTIWDEGLSNPDRYGYIASTQDEADDEGHSWTIIGADRERVRKKGATPGAVRMINSWGEGWAEKGRAWLEFAELDKLIKLQGEAATAKEIKRVMA